MILSLTLPWPPTLNNLYPSRRGRRVLSEEGRAYQVKCRIAINKQIGNAKTMHGRIGYRMRFLVPDNRRRDLPNVIKAVEDNLTKCGVWADDSQVDDGRFLRGPATPGGLVEVEVWELSPSPDGACNPESVRKS